MLEPVTVLSIDMSSKTGWSFITSKQDGIILHASGQIPAIPEPDGVYPNNYVDWAYLIFGKVVELIDRFAPDCLVIEETVAGSKSVYSQKILEFSHFLFAKMIRDSGIKVKYFLTGEWRTVVGCLMTKEEKLRNKAVKAHNDKEKLVNGKITARARNKDGKAIGKISKKHVNIRRANEIYGAYLDKPLVKQNEDEADALLLAYAYHLVRMRTV